MQGPSHQLLAGTGFTQDQHRWRHAVAEAQVGLEDLAQPLVQFAHRRRLPQQGRHSALPGLAPTVVGKSTLEPLLAHRLLDRELELGQRDRLGQVVERTRLHRLHGGLDRSVSGQHDHLGRLATLAKTLQQFEPVSVGQPEVEQHEVGSELVESLGGFA